MCFVFFFFNDTATTEIYTLSLHDALPIYSYWQPPSCILAQRIEIRNLEVAGSPHGRGEVPALCFRFRSMRSEEHTSELQSPCNLVCRLLLEKKNTMETFTTLIAAGISPAS